MIATGSSAVRFGVGLVLYATVTFLAFSPTLAIYCGVCDPRLCSPDPPGLCRGGITTDFCGCCEVCAKLVNESCGGKYGLLGKCGDGLKCVISPTIGQPISGQEEGVCHAKNCTSDDCETADVTIQCPSNSQLVQNATEPGDQYVCQCNMTLCQVPSCAAGFETVLLNKGNSLPGTCCDEFVCKRTAVCRSVICPPAEEKQCPGDSQALPSRLTEDGCCLIQQGCKCQHRDHCPPVECPQGSQIQVVSKATDMPGSCCDKFQCVKDSGLMCFYEGHEFHDGESWHLEKCTTCTCKEGLTFCKTKSCNAPLCGWMVIPDGECCPVCKGCVSDSGQLFNNSDVWKENPCVTCQCDAGQVLCQAEMCAVRCSKPRNVPGQCCPVCDDIPPVDTPRLCPSSENCSLTCTNGLEKTPEDCFLCKCKKEICTLDCKYGFKTDQKGKKKCECTEPHNQCPSLDTCNKRCTYGFKISRNGCMKCRCNKCPPFNCTKRCLYHYLVNDQGCQLCKCQEAPVQPTTPSLIDQKPDLTDSNDKACLSSSGHRHEDGESWHDGCRLCYCHNGHEMCSLIACPVPRCKNPIFRIGDCCPSCPGASLLSQTAGRKESCQSATGHYLVEGEMWKIDNCTQCICHDGSILCDTPTCPPVLCHYPVKAASQCCALCKGHDSLPTVPVLMPRPCKIESRITYKHGDIWKTSPCQSCTCRHGQVSCYSQMCTPLNCNKTVLRKGQCCPNCLDVNHPGVCTSSGIRYSQGETWVSDNCTECVCSNGNIVCIPMPCLQLTCTVMIRKPGQCCPVCYDEAVTTTVIEKDRATPDDFMPTRYTEGPTEDFTGKKKYEIVIIALGVLLAVVLIALLILVLVMLRRRHTGIFKMTDTDNVTNIKIRPKSTNLDLQGVNPFLMDQVPQNKPINCESLNKLEKPPLSLGPAVVPPEKCKLADLTSNQYIHNNQEPTKDVIVPSGHCVSNKTFQQV